MNPKNGDSLLALAKLLGCEKDVKVLQQLLNKAGELPEDDVVVQLLMLFGVFSNLLNKLPERVSVEFEKFRKHIKEWEKLHHQEIANQLNGLQTKQIECIEAFLNSEAVQNLLRERLQSAHTQPLTILQEQEAKQKLILEDMQESASQTGSLLQNLDLYWGRMKLIILFFAGLFVAMNGWEMWLNRQATELSRVPPIQRIKSDFAAINLNVHVENDNSGTFVVFQIPASASGKGYWINQKSPSILEVGIVETNNYPPSESLPAQ